MFSWKWWKLSPNRISLFIWICLLNGRPCTSSCVLMKIALWTDCCVCIRHVTDWNSKITDLYCGAFCIKNGWWIKLIGQVDVGIWRVWMSGFGDTFMWGQIIWVLARYMTLNEMRGIELIEFRYRGLNNGKRNENTFFSKKWWISSSAIGLRDKI